MKRIRKLRPMLFIGFLSIVAAACAPLTAQAPVGSASPEDVTDEVLEATVSPTHIKNVEGCGDPFKGVEIFFRQTVWLERTNFCEHSVDLSEIFTGNPVPDAIPAIDNPVFENVEEAGVWLGEDWPVMLFEIYGDVRAYPLAILIWHEIVNDAVAGEPVVVTFCPLCNATIAFRRTLDDGQALTFVAKTGGVEDQETETRWNLLGHAVAGPLEGAQLDRIVSGEHLWFSWAAFKPDTVVWSSP